MRIIGATICRFLYGRRVVSAPRDEAHRSHTQMFRQHAISGEDGRELLLECQPKIRTESLGIFVGVMRNG